ncbi:MAG: SRPBCC family protein [Acidobacteria bacterium]|nr:MAG: SRPBCC family protein [Acidobacteriota bacterium]
MLGLAFRSPESEPRRLAAATAAVAGVTALDIVAGRRLQLAPGGRRFQYATRALTVNRPPAEVYGFWRDLENLPRFMRHLESVRTTEPGRSRWKVKGPAGTSVEWDAEIVEDRPSELIAWRSLPGASVENGGFVRFRPAPGGKATEVKVHLEYHPPGGRLGSAVASLFGEEPEQQLQEDLRRFKQVMETGEIARSDASEGLLGMKPGRPAPAATYEDFARGKR